MRAHIIGVSVSEISAETPMAIASVTANSRNSRPTMPPMSRMGMNTASSDAVMLTIVKPICLAPLERRLDRRHALLDEARDVLGHDDGVVDDEAGRDGQRHQRQVVDAVADRYMTPKVPTSDSGTATDGITVAHTLRRNTKTTKHDQRHRDHERRLDVGHRGADGLRAVDRQVHVDGRRDRVRQLRDAPS